MSRKGDVALTPQIAFTGTKATIEAWSSAVLGMEAIATDTSEKGVYDGTDWQWSPIAGGGSAAWGAIAGTLSDQTDLQTELDGKQSVDAILTSLAGLAIAAGDIILGLTSSTLQRLGVGVDTSDSKFLKRGAGPSYLHSWATPTTAEVSSSTDKRYVTDAELGVIGNTSGTNTGDGASISINGWNSAATTWTRTGNHSFTVSGDVTSDHKYKKGNWVRYKDGGSYEYGIILSTSYSSPNTTVNLIPNTTYAMAAATITDNYTSNIINPEGVPSYLSSTPTVNGLTTPVYNSQVARFSNMGNGSLFYAARIDITSWAGQTGFIRFVLPADAVYIAGGNYGVGSYYRNGTSAQQGTHALIPLSATELGMATNDAASAVSWEASARVVITCSITYNF